MAQSGQIAAAKETPTGTGVNPNHPLTGRTEILDAEQGIVRFLNPDGTPRKRFALCGFASSSREMAPYNEDGWAIVGMNQLYRHIPRADCWFEIHKEWNAAVVPGTDHEGWLRDCGIPILMTNRIASAPTSVKFPIDRFIGKFSDYFTSTVAYMVAFFTDYIDRDVETRLRAIAVQERKVARGARSKATAATTAWDVAERVRAIYAEYTIGIFGIDLIVGEEYTWQRPCAEYYLGQALARNITVMIPPQSALLQQRYRYGYQMSPTDLVSDVDIEKRRVELTNQHQNHVLATAELTGALKELSLLNELYSLRSRGGTVGI